MSRFISMVLSCTGGEINLFQEKTKKNNKKNNPICWDVRKNKRQRFGNIIKPVNKTVHGGWHETIQFFFGAPSSHGKSGNVQCFSVPIWHREMSTLSVLLTFSNGHNLMEFVGCNMRYRLNYYHVHIFSQLGAQWKTLHWQKKLIDLNCIFPPVSSGTLGKLRSTSSFFFKLVGFRLFDFLPEQHPFAGAMNICTTYIYLSPAVIFPMFY